MADDLSQLGVSWVEESALRDEVVAEVDAQVVAEAAMDEAELRRRWEALGEMEHVVAELHSLAAQSQKGSASSRGVAEVLGGKSDKEGKREEENTAAVLQFRLAKAQREVENRAKLLRRWQVEMEGRQRKRLEEAKKQRQLAGKEEEEVAAERRKSNVSGNTAVASAGLHGVMDTTSITAAMNVSGLQVASSLSSLISAASPPKAADDTRREPKIPLKARVVSNDAAKAAHSRTATQPQRCNGSGSHPSVAMTASEYAGGAILPSLYRVTLTRSDLRSKSIKYADDGDLDVFHARQQKRRRLEEVAATMAASHLALSHSGTVKLEAAGSTGSMKVKQENDEKGESGNTLKEAIDVDALMEKVDDDDDDDKNVMRQLLMNSGGGCDNNSTVHSVNRREHETSVSIFPGISLLANIYNRLLEHQRDGIKWLLRLHTQRMGGILGDEMGLGKTIQVASMLNALHHSQQLRDPCLIVSPLTVLRQWVAEMHRWAPYIRTCVMHESSATNMSREKLIQSIRSTPAVLLTTYAAVRQHCHLLHTARFQYVILDEGHKISNPEATVTLAAKSFPTPHRLILSGTPIQNTLKELWCLFDFVRPGLLGTMTKFVEEFEEPINASKDVRASPLALATAVECAQALRERIAPYLLRRLKRQVMSDALPQKYERVIRCPLSDDQLEAYVELLTSSRVQRLLSSTLTSPQLMGGLNCDGRDANGCLHIAGIRFQLFQRQYHGGIRLEAFRVLNELRQICNHVDIFRLRRAAKENGAEYFDDDEEEDETDGVDGKKKRRRGSHMSLRSNRLVNYSGSGKLQTLQKLLTVWQRGGQRVLVFSQTRMALDIIENMCEQEGFKYIRMDGSTSGHHRQELMDRFNEDDSIVAALLTTRVGGVGVNLVGANRVVLFDPDWNPVTDEQARERAWRIGQTRDVGVYRLIASGTVEEAILRRQLAKTYVTEKVLHNPALQRFFHQQESLTETFYLGAEYDSRVPVGKKHILATQEISPLLEAEEDDDGREQDDGAKVMQEKGAAAVYRVRATTMTNKLNASSTPSTSTAASSSRAETALLQDLVDGQEVRVSGGDAIARRLARLSAAQTMQRVTNTTRTIEQQQAEMRMRALREVKGENGD
ncbi:putative DNA excision repair protein [Trypanosoma cruzi]|uniref:DNA excision repair protein, putative n=2 Tax=Trypanosoma cruzi TaxID=5693 RepID=Q4D067_TRYCC|nr:DNA excision repair protein, putative [Trypanosoma cruzi]EAN85915.1 DNA excision repair protein, putative [Trypanosoma cruzi]PWV07452.1 putative DNA excision repair protein [Trypanosoma cruzi]RNC59326.1 putative SNF2 family helicase-like protein putativeDNA excision repair protein [Trypanosoma cruzi]|eukprot:XP_807766.1 DNA excision repair protein [Trypanosoma cruzi strain CL Brener]